MPEDESAGTKTRSIKLDPDLAAAIGETAAARGISDAAVIRDWLRRGRAAYVRERRVVAEVLGDGGEGAA